MKKVILFSLLAVISFTLPSCLDNDGENTQTISLDMISRKVQQGSTAVATLNEANYRFDFDFSAMTVDITAYDAQISLTAFSLNDVPLTINNYGYVFHTDQVIPVDGAGIPLSQLTVTNLYGQLYNSLELTFSIGSNSYNVFPEEYTYAISSTVTDSPDGDLFQWGSAYYTLDFDVEDSGLVTCDLTISNIKFTDMMPAQTAMEFSDIIVTPTSRGLTLEANRIIPTINDVPYPDYAVTNFFGSINPNFSTTTYFTGERFTAAFECMGMDVNVTAYLYDQTDN